MNDTVTVIQQLNSLNGWSALVIIAGMLFAAFVLYHLIFKD